MDDGSWPIPSMYGIFTYIWLIFIVNVGKYTSPMDPMGDGQEGSRVGCEHGMKDRVQKTAWPNHQTEELKPSKFQKSTNG